MKNTSVRINFNPLKISEEDALFYVLYTIKSEAYKKIELKTDNMFMFYDATVEYRKNKNSISYFVWKCDNRAYLKEENIKK